MVIPIVFENSDFWVIDKPELMYVHQPEDPTYRARPEQVLLNVFRDQVNQYLYPVHRLDFAASGLLIFAKRSEVARDLNKALAEGSVDKKYHAIVRGWPKDQDIDRPLQSDATDAMLPAATKVRLCKKMFIGDPVGTRAIPAHYAWVEATPESGRYHQIRRHLNGIAHPIIGDTDHGDSRHNKFVRERLKIPGLNLRCVELKFQWHGETVCIQAPTPARWKEWEKIFDEYGS